jgi:hypothetical protein
LVRRRFTEHRDPNPETTTPLDDNHAAVVEGRTLFPSRVFQPTPYVSDPLVSGVNARKIGDRIIKGRWAGYRIYTLTLEERATCPRTCKQWTTCYGTGMQFARRWAHGRDLEFAITAQLLNFFRFPKARIAVRLHVLGDFYDEKYVWFWRSMLDQFPGLVLFGFTAHDKNSVIGDAVLKMNRDFPARCSIRFSGDGGAMGSVVINHIPERVMIDQKTFTCPAQLGKTDCCGTCGLCWSEAMDDKAVAFVLHGVERRRPRQAPELPQPDLEANIAMSEEKKKLAKSIERYWRDKGYDVTVYVDESGEIKSSLVAGVPKNIDRRSSVVVNVPVSRLPDTDNPPQPAPQHRTQTKAGSRAGITDKRAEQIKAMWYNCDDYSVADIVDRFSISVPLLYRLAKECGWEFRSAIIQRNARKSSVPKNQSVNSNPPTQEEIDETL